MSAETLSPLSSTPEKSSKHPASESGFLDSVLSSSDADSSRRQKREKRPTVESIDPKDIHLYDGVDLDHVMLARESLSNFEKGTDEYEEDREFLLDTMLEGLDTEHSAYARKRGELSKLITAPDAKFEKAAQRLERAQARVDGVKLVTPKPEKAEDESARFVPASIERITSKIADSRKRVTESGLRRDIRSIDRNFKGLVGDIAATDTKASYLESKYDEFAARMDAFGAEVNAKNRRSVERETVRKLMDAEALADRKGLEGEARRAYIDGLVDTFHSYVTLDDDARARFDKTLEIRQRADEELRAMERQRAIDTTPELEKGESRRTRLMRGIGAVAAGLRARGKDRWEARKARQEDDQPALFDDKPYRKKSRVATMMATPTTLYHDLNARAVNRRVRRDEKLAAMTDEEREVYERKGRRNRVIVAVGATALAITGAALALKYGVDNWSGDASGSGGSRELPGSGRIDGLMDMDHDGIPDSIDTDRGHGDVSQGPVRGLDTLSDSGDGQQSSRQELFSGRGGTRKLSGANMSELRDFMAEYKVKPGDDKGVWGISTKYLHSQGIANPTVYEIDAVKDYILENSNLTNRSVIHPGDTIKLK